jgi:hypothetical protein
MIRIPKVTMTMRELDRLKCIQGLIDGQLKQHAVATRLGLTTRQVPACATKVRGRGTCVWDSKVSVRRFWPHIGCREAQRTPRRGPGG